MKASIKTRSNLVIDIEAETQKDLFAKMASTTDVFGEKACGICGCEHIIPVVRKVLHKKKEVEYHEWHCTACFARLTLSQNLVGGTLFPNRKLLPSGKPATGEERALPDAKYVNGGWTKYKGEPTEEKGE